MDLISYDGITCDQETLDKFDMLMALGLEGEIFGYPTAEPKPVWALRWEAKQNEGDRFPCDYEGGKDE